MRKYEFKICKINTLNTLGLETTKFAQICWPHRTKEQVNLNSLLLYNLDYYYLVQLFVRARLFYIWGWSVLS